MEEVKNIKSHTFKIRQPDGSTAKAIIFCDAEGFVSGVSNLDQLVDWSQRRAAPVVDAQAPLVITDEVKRNMRFFSDHTPCWFPGCDKLRESYKAELAKLESEGECKGCEKGAVIRKYIQLVSLAQKRR